MRRLVLGMGLACAACGDAAAPPEALDVSATFSDGTPADTLRSIGALAQLRATLRLANGATEATTDVQWRSSAPDIISVLPGGLATAQGPGTATLTGTTPGSLEASVSLVVHQRAVRLQASVSRLSAAELDTVYVAAFGYDFYGHPVEDRAPTWSVSDSALARVEPDGVIIATRAGTVTLTATLDDGTESADLTIHDGFLAQSLASVSWGADRTCALDLEQRAYCWSGMDTIAAPFTDRRWQSLSLGLWHSCGIATDNTAWCWGRNVRGQLGNGMTSVSGSAVPVAPGGGLRAREIVASDFDFTCAIDLQGMPLCWGRNDAAQLGRGGFSTQELDLAPPMDAVTVQAIDVASFQTCAVGPGGSLYCWGRWTAAGEADTLLVPTALAGAQEFKSIRGANGLFCGLTVDGGVSCWGVGAPGAAPYTLTPTPVADAPPLATLTVGSLQGCGLTTDGEAWCWGFMSGGAVGTVQYNTAAPLATPLRFRAINARYTAGSVCGITLDGAVMCRAALGEAFVRIRRPAPGGSNGLHQTGAP